jgi:hypothetical protein
MIQSLLSLAIFGSFVWFAIITAVLLYLFFLSESEEQGFIAFAAVIAYGVINYFWGNVPLQHLLDTKLILSYLGLGLIFAIVRTYFFGRELKGMAEKLDSHYIDKLKGNVFRWWFLFPISLIFWLVSDLFGDLWDYVWDKISNGFEYILKAGFNSKKTN